MFNKVKQFVNEAFEKSGHDKGIDHLKRTVYWTKKLKPDADEPILIAAYAHDIERGFRKIDIKKLFKDKEFDDPEILEHHQKKGARIISEFLKKNNYNENTIKRIENMVSHHEVGGNKESNLIKDADTISYLETNAERHIQLIPTLDKSKIRRKIDFMYNRLSSQKAKEFARPYYENVIKKINSKINL